MKFTVEQFVELFNGLIESVVWKFSRQYKLSQEDSEDLRSELFLRAIKWFHRYPNIIERATEESEIGALLKHHLKHKSLSYIHIHLTKHWVVDRSLDYTKDTMVNSFGHVSPSGLESVIQVEDPRAERAMLAAGLRGMDMKLATEVLDMLPAEDREILCVHYSLPGYEDRVSVVDAERIETAVSRLDRAAKARRMGKSSIKFHKSWQRKRPKKILARMDSVLAYIRENAPCTSQSVVEGIQVKYVDVRDAIQNLKKENRVMIVGYGPRKTSGKKGGASPPLYGLVPLISPNENGSETGPEGVIPGTSAEL